MNHPKLLAVTAIVLFSRPGLSQARSVSVPAEPSLLNLTTSWSRASTLGDLRQLRTRPDHIELRVWRGYGPSETQAIVVRRTDGHWSALLGRVLRCEIQIATSVGDTASEATMRRYAAEARSKCGVSVANAGPGARIIATDTLLVQPLAVPEPEIEMAWKESVGAGVLQLPVRVKRSRPMDDSVTYLIEMRRGDEYRVAEIEELERPEVEADRQVKQIYAAVRRLMQRREP